MKAMILKEFRELRRDRRTVAMLVALPIVLLVIFGYAANFTIDSISTKVVGPGAEQVQSALPPLFDASGTDDGTDGGTDPDATAQEAQDLVRDNVADVVIDTGTTPPTAYVDGSNLFVAQ